MEPYLERVLWHLRLGNILIVRLFQADTNIYSDQSMFYSHLSTFHSDTLSELFQSHKKFLAADLDHDIIPFYNGEPDIRGLWSPIRTKVVKAIKYGWRSRTMLIDVLISNTALASQASDLQNTYDITSSSGPPKILYLMGWPHYRVAGFVAFVPLNLKDASNKIQGEIRVELKMSDTRKTYLVNECGGSKVPVSMEYENSPANSIRLKAWTNYDKSFFASTYTITINAEVYDSTGDNLIGKFQCQLKSIRESRYSLSEIFGGDFRINDQDLRSPSIFKLHYFKMGVVHGGGKPYLTSSVPTACQIPGARYQVGRYFEKAIPTDCLNPYILFDKECVLKDTANTVANCDLVNSASKCVKCLQGYYLDPRDNSCQACPRNCVSCTRIACKRCKVGYVFTDNGGETLCTLFSSLPNHSSLFINPNIQAALPKHFPALNPNIFTNQSFTKQTVRGDPEVYTTDIYMNASAPGQVLFYSLKVFMQEDNSVNPIYAHYDVTVKVAIPGSYGLTICGRQSLPFSVSPFSPTSSLSFYLQFLYPKWSDDPVKVSFFSKYPAVLQIEGAYNHPQAADTDCWMPLTSRKCFYCNHKKNLWNYYGKCRPSPDGFTGDGAINFETTEGLTPCYHGQRLCSRFHIYAALACYDGNYLHENYEGSPYRNKCIACNPNCKTCAFEPTNCLSCNSNLYLKKTSEDRDPVRHKCVHCRVPNCFKCEDHSLKCTECYHPYFLISGECSLFPPPESKKEGPDLKNPNKLDVSFSYLSSQRRLRLAFYPTIQKMSQSLKFRLHFDKEKLNIDLKGLGFQKPAEEYSPGEEVLNAQPLELNEKGEIFLDLVYKEKISADELSVVLEVLEDLLVNLFEASSDSSDSSNASQMLQSSGDRKLQEIVGSSERWALKKGNYSLSNTISFYKDTKATEIVKTASAYSSVAVKTVMGMSLVTLSGSFSSLLKLTQHIELLSLMNLTYMPDNLKIFLKYFSENLSDVFFNPFKNIKNQACLPKRTFEENEYECYLIKNIGGLFTLTCLCLLYKVIVWILRRYFLMFKVLNKSLNMSFFFMFFDAFSVDLFLYILLDFSSSRQNSSVSIASRAISGILCVFCTLMIIWLTILSVKASKVKKEKEDTPKENNDKQPESSEKSSPSSSTSLKQSAQLSQEWKKSDLAQNSSLLKKARPPGSPQPLNLQNSLTIVKIPELENNTSTLKSKTGLKSCLTKILLNSSPSQYLLEDFKEKKILKYHRLIEHLRLLCSCGLLFLFYNHPLWQVVTIFCLNLPLVVGSCTLTPWKKPLDNFVNLTVGICLTISRSLIFFFVEFKASRPILTSQTNYVGIGFIVMSLLVVIIALVCIKSMIDVFQILKRAFIWFRKTPKSDMAKSPSTTFKSRRMKKKVFSSPSNVLQKPTVNFATIPPVSERGKAQSDEKAVSPGRTSLDFKNDKKVILDQTRSKGLIPDNLSKKSPNKSKLRLRKTIAIPKLKNPI